MVTAQRGEEMTKKLVVPLDGSKLGETVLPWASALARETQASLLLVRIALSRQYGTGYLAMGVHKQHTLPEWREAEAYLGQVKRRLEKDGLQVHTRVREGLIAENVLDIADDEDASAITLTTHGRHGFARFFLGSVAEGLVHETRIPLFVVPAAAGRRGRAPSFQRILVPLNGSPLAEQALEFISDITSPETTIVLVRVVSPDDVEADVPNTLVVGQDAHHRAETDARNYLQGVAHQLHSIGRKAQIMSSSGRPAHEILIAAHAAEADVIAMTTHGRTGPGRWRLGSVADEVVRHGDMPVLLISARTVAAGSGTQLKVADIMVRNPVVLGTADTVAVALRKMLRRRVAASAVVDDDGDLIGMLSQHDLASWADRRNAGRSTAAELPTRAQEDTVGDLLTEETISIDESAPLTSAMRVFSDERLAAIAVARDGHLVGVVTLQDVLEALVGIHDATKSVGATAATPA